MRLAVFVDQVYWKDGDVISNDESFTLFLMSLRKAFGEIVLIGRVAPDAARKPYVLPGEGVSVCAIPYYRRVLDLWRSGRFIYENVRKILKTHANEWDAILVCGPNPIANRIAKMCIEMGMPTALVVRQNLVPQVRFANRGLRGLVAVPAAIWLEWQFRQLARNRIVFVVGQEMARAYGRATMQVHDFHGSLIDEEQMARLATLELKPDPRRLLFVGRLSSEKGIDYLLNALVQLKRAGEVYPLDIVGSGPIEDQVKAEVTKLGLDDQVALHGYVTFGDKLLDFYKRASILIVPSLSGEGLPGVINEALAVGVPVIASRVGGIPDFVADGRTAVLIPPANVAAIVAAIEQLKDPRFREKLIANGRDLMRPNTLEANGKIIADALFPESKTSATHDIAPVGTSAVREPHFRRKTEATKASDDLG